MVKTGGNAMKKIISFFAMAAMLLVSCTNELDDNNSVAGGNPSEEGIFAPGKYTFNVTVADTKAVKTAWEHGDKIFVFFDDAKTKAATGVSNLPYVTLTFNGEDWVADDGKAPTEIPASGTLSAVYCPYGAGEITTENGIFYVSRSHGFYMEATDVPYANVENEVTFSLSMAMKQPYAHFIIPSEGLDKTKSYTLSVRNTDKTAGIQKTFTACINPADGSVYCKAQNVGDAVDGYWDEDGLHFYGLASLGEDKGLAFDLRDNSSPQILYSYAKTGIEKFEGGSNVKLAAISNWTTLTSAEHKQCHLYTDGTLIINENRYNQADNALKHGAIVKTYPQVTSFNMNGTQPWKSELSDIRRAEFGTSVQPDQFRFVFQDCTNLETVDVTNLDMSKSTSLKNAFKNCKKLTTIDLSNFVTSNCTSLEATFFSCEALNPDVSTWDTSNVTTMSGTFYGCKFTSIDVSSFDTSKVTIMNQMFCWCNYLQTILVSDKFVTKSVTDGANMFRACSAKLKGQNGTVWSESQVSSVYACVDTEGTPGYFTLKQ